MFGLLADRFGRRPMLMLDIALFSFFELASAFAPNLAALFVLRLLFGFAMGGEWGLGSSLTMEIIPEKSRGFVSGLLQEGYACGNLLAALLFWLLFDHIGWRGMFVVGSCRRCSCSTSARRFRNRRCGDTRSGQSPRRSAIR